MLNQVKGLSMKALILTTIILYLPGCVNAEQNNTRNGDDFCKILQLTVDLPKLQQFFHVEEIPNRSPLRVAISDINTNCVSLTKFGKKVILFDKNAINKPIFPFLEILEINITANLATMSIEYSPEGVKGTAKLKKNDGKWELYKSHIVEM